MDIIRDNVNQREAERGIKNPHWNPHESIGNTGLTWSELEIDWPWLVQLSSHPSLLRVVPILWHLQEKHVSRNNIERKRDGDPHCAHTNTHGRSAHASETIAHIQKPKPQTQILLQRNYCSMCGHNRKYGGNMKHDEKKIITYIIYNN